MTLVATYFLILVGGIVRSTGSGMGCPDWPKCFGSWIPPTSESQLPENYKQYYVNYRHEKNMRFASYLDILGFREKANMLRSDKSISEETGFNAFKTWTEYLNRLTGSLIGIFVIINLAASIPLRKTNKKLFIFSILLLFIVVFQGWIGSVVVSTNLVPWMVTVHMLLAMIIVAIIIYLIYLSRKNEINDRIMVAPRPVIKIIVIISIILLGIQVSLGTQVREVIDSISMSLNFQDRSTWLTRAGTAFLVHRSFSLVILISQGIIIYYLLKMPVRDNILLRFAGLLLIFTLLEVILGAIMAYAGLPAIIQPVHLLIAILVFGIQFVFVLITQHKKTMTV